MPDESGAPTVSELRRQVIAGCGGGAMLYDKATELVDEYAAAVRMAERHRMGAEMVNAGRVPAGSTYPLRERLSVAAAGLDRHATAVGVVSAAAGARVLRWVAGYLAAPGFAADSATVAESGSDERAAICPEHHQTDCSPLLNGCSRLTAGEADARPDRQPSRPAETLMMWHWLSFADPNRPEGQQLLGVAIVQAENVVHAALVARALGINPGGEVQAVTLGDYEPADGYTNRLFTGDEAKRIAASDPPVYLRNWR